ncbi:hypothetical protein CI238_02732 [Colletotrichum incanum]|uniref:Uncharacterized protein n=1 Tax=Colletotrichum incanum TaxID=1573173 RepID=A0A167DNR8_COLIC|nr:hypothetical protein CI238_02732 [Colletotrichum incanum]
MDRYDLHTAFLLVDDLDGLIGQALNDIFILLLASRCCQRNLHDSFGCEVCGSPKLTLAEEIEIFAEQLRQRQVELAWEAQERLVGLRQLDLGFLANGQGFFDVGIMLGAHIVLENISEKVFQHADGLAHLRVVPRRHCRKILGQEARSDASEVDIPAIRVVVIVEATAAASHVDGVDSHCISLLLWGHVLKVGIDVATEHARSGVNATEKKVLVEGLVRCTQTAAGAVALDACLDASCAC